VTVADGDRKGGGGASGVSARHAVERGSPLGRGSACLEVCCPRLAGCHWASSQYTSEHQRTTASWAAPTWWKGPRWTVMAAPPAGSAEATTRPVGAKGLSIKTPTWTLGTSSPVEHDVAAVTMDAGRVQAVPHLAEKLSPKGGERPPSCCRGHNSCRASGHLCHGHLVVHPVILPIQRRPNHQEAPLPPSSARARSRRRVSRLRRGVQSHDRPRIVRSSHAQGPSTARHRITRRRS